MSTWRQNENILQSNMSKGEIGLMSTLQKVDDSAIDYAAAAAKTKLERTRQHNLS